MDSLNAEPETTFWPGPPPVLAPVATEIGRWQSPAFDRTAWALVERSGLQRHLLQAWIEDLICALVPLEALENKIDSRLADERLALFKQAAFSLHVEEHFSRTKRSRERIIYSLLRCSDSGRIQELNLAIREGELDFANAAIRYSEGPESAQGGRIGPISPQASHPEITQRLEQSNEGDLIGPFTIGGTHVLLRLDTRISVRLDDSTQPQLIEELYQDWLERQINALLKGESIEPFEYLPTS